MQIFFGCFFRSWCRGATLSQHFNCLEISGLLRAPTTPSGDCGSPSQISRDRALTGQHPPTLLLRWEKARKTHQKRKGFFVFAHPPEILWKEGKNAQKTRKIAKRKNKKKQKWISRQIIVRGGGYRRGGYLSGIYPNRSKCLVSKAEERKNTEHVPRTHRCAWCATTNAFLRYPPVQNPPLRWGRKKTINTKHIFFWQPFKLQNNRPKDQLGPVPGTNGTKWRFEQKTAGLSQGRVPFCPRKGSRCVPGKVPVCPGHRPSPNACLLGFSCPNFSRFPMEPFTKLYRGYSCLLVPTVKRY